MSTATLRVYTNEVDSPRLLPLSALFGNQEQACADGQVGDAIPENTVFGATIAAANAAAADQLSCTLGWEVGGLSLVDAISEINDFSGWETGS